MPFKTILNSIGGVVKTATEFYEDVSETVRSITPEPINKIADDLTGLIETAYQRSPMGVADEGASIVSEQVGQFNPTAGFVTGLVLGAVVPGPSKGGIRLTRVGRQFPEMAQEASNLLENAPEYVKKRGSLKGYDTLTDPTGKIHKVRPRGKNPDNTTRYALSPIDVKRAYTKKRNALDVTSNEFEGFERKNFEASFKKEKQDLIFQKSGLPAYKEHNRRLNSPFWKSARAKNQAPGDINNLSIVNDLEFKTFKDNVDKILDNTKDSPIDAFYDPMIESVVVENIKTGERLGLLDQTKDIKKQLNRYAQKAL